MRKSPETLQKYSIRLVRQESDRSKSIMHRRLTRRDCPGGGLSPGVAAKVQMSIYTSMGNPGKRENCVAAMFRISG